MNVYANKKFENIFLIFRFYWISKKRRKNPANDGNDVKDDKVDIDGEECGGGSKLWES